MLTAAGVPVITSEVMPRGHIHVLRPPKPHHFSPGRMTGSLDIIKLLHFMGHVTARGKNIDFKPFRFKDDPLKNCVGDAEGEEGKPKLTDGGDPEEER